MEYVNKSATHLKNYHRKWDKLVYVIVHIHENEILHHKLYKRGIFVL